MNVVSFTKENALLGHESWLLWLKGDITYYCTFCVFTTREQISIRTDTNTAEKCRLSFQILWVVSHWVIITSKENLLSLLPFKVFSKGWTFFNCMVALIVTKLKGIYIYLLFFIFIFKPGFYKHQSLQRIWCRLSKYIWKPYTVNHFKLTLKLSLKILKKSLL